MVLLARRQGPTCTLRSIGQCSILKVLRCEHLNPRSLSSVSDDDAVNDPLCVAQTRKQPRPEPLFKAEACHPRIAVGMLALEISPTPLGWVSRAQRRGKRFRVYTYSGPANCHLMLSLPPRLASPRFRPRNFDVYNDQPRDHSSVTSTTFRLRKKSSALQQGTVSGRQLPSRRIAHRPQPAVPTGPQALLDVESRPVRTATQSHTWPSAHCCHANCLLDENPISCTQLSRIGASSSYSQRASRAHTGIASWHLRGR